MRKFCFALCFVAFFVSAPSANALLITATAAYLESGDGLLVRNFESDLVAGIDNIKNYQVGTGSEIKFSASADLLHFDVGTLATGGTEFELITDLLKGFGFSFFLDEVFGETVEVLFTTQVWFKLEGLEGERAVIDFSLEASGESKSYFGGTAATVASGIYADAGIRLNADDDTWNALDYVEVDSYSSTDFVYNHIEEQFSLSTNYSREMEVGDSGIITTTFSSGVLALLPNVNAGLVFTQSSTNFNWTLSATTIPPDPDPVVPVPEPSTFLLLGGGLAGLAFTVRRRRKE